MGTSGALARAVKARLNIGAASNKLLIFPAILAQTERGDAPQIARNMLNIGAACC